MGVPNSTFLIACALLAAVGCDHCSCGSDSKSSSSQKQSSRPTRATTPKKVKVDIDAPAEVDKRRAELLRRSRNGVTKRAVVTPANPSTKVSKKDIKPISKDVVMVGNARVDMAKNRVEVPATVVLAPDQIVEYVAVEPSGKTYESLLSADVEQIHLRLALTMIGAVEAAHTTTAANADASHVRIFVRIGSIGDKKSKKEFPASELLYDRATKKHLRGHFWAFNSPGGASRGSWVFSGSLVAAVDDPSAIVRTTNDNGNAYANANAGLIPNPKRLPAVGTKVTLIFEHAGTPKNGGDKQ